MKLPRDVEAKVLALAGEALPVGLAEKAFQAKVIELARHHGWLCFHVFDSRKCEPGFPDLVMVRPVDPAHPHDRGVIFAELKTATGETTAEQRTWIAGLVHAGVPTYVWRPSCWPDIVRILGGRS